MSELLCLSLRYGFQKGCNRQPFAIQSWSHRSQSQKHPCTFMSDSVGNITHQITAASFPERLPIAALPRGNPENSE